MNVDTDRRITLTEEEAVALRTALHIATRLTAVAPEPFNRPSLSAQFKALHSVLVDAGVDILPNTPQFSDDIVHALKQQPHPDDQLMKDLLFPLPPLRGEDLTAFLTKGYGGKTVTGRIPRGPSPWIVEGNFPASGYQPSWQEGLHQKSFPTAPAAYRAAHKFGCKGVEYRIRNMDTNESVPVVFLKVEEQKQWIIQFRHDYSGAAADWRRLQGSSSSPGIGVYSSRNEAYRQMRARINKLGFPAERYRVVPEGTPNGPEKNRGYYMVEYWNRLRQAWVETTGGPGFDNRAAFRGPQYHDSATAHEDIEKHGFKDMSYRVKWHPNTP